MMEPQSPLHLILHFSEMYPTFPPSITCCTPFPHGNVVRKADGTYTLCLDMLDPPSKGTSKPYAGWSSAMTVYSILCQLQAFLTRESLQYAENMGTMTTAHRRMQTFKCNTCPHDGSISTWPPARSPTTQPAQRRLVCRPCGTVVLSDKAAPQPALPTAPATVNATLDEATPNGASPPPFKHKKAQPVSLGVNRFAILLTAPTDSVASQAKKTPALVLNAAQLATAALSSDSTPQVAIPTTPMTILAASTSSEPSQTKAQRKNAQRLRRRHERRNQPSTSPVSSPPTSTPPSTATTMISLASDSSGSRPSCASWTEDVIVAVDSIDEAEGNAEAEANHASFFALLGYDALIILMELLVSEADVRAVACTCRYLSRVCEDGLLWRVLFAKHFPASQLSAASLGDWKHTFMLELASNSDRFVCFHSKVELGALDAKRKQLEVFGIPLRCTTNPRTREVDYIYSSMETLSYSAFADDRVRRTVWGEEFSQFMPLYLTAKHFEVAKPILKRTLVSLCQGSPRWSHAKGAFQPEMVLDVLPKLLCTMGVLVCDKGVAASDVFLDGFVQIYRLLLALADETPRLRKHVTQRVRGFIRSETLRTKDAEPSLGSLIPLLGIANGVRWCDLAWPLLREQFDRSILFSCRAFPQLAKPAELTQDQLFELTWRARLVAHRLMMFNYGFLARLSKISTAQLDQFHGQPTPWLRGSMRQHLSKVFATDSWPAYFSMINVPLPTKAFLQSWIVESVGNSLKKGYHKAGMDFSRVQRSGCSAILRKGESVSCQTTMKRIRLEEVWRWRGNENLFLDASALMYSFDNKPLATVDYSNTRSVTGASNSGDGYGRYTDGRVRTAVRHSGDQIEHDRNEGKHTIDIDLRALSTEVGSIFLTLSAWTTPLSHIIRPEVRCFDPDDKSGEPLVQYELEDRPTGNHTAVIMARIWRSEPGKPWKVTAIGELGKGRANRSPGYKPIHDRIANFLSLEEGGGDSMGS